MARQVLREVCETWHFFFLNHGFLIAYISYGIYVTIVLTLSQVMYLSIQQLFVIFLYIYICTIFGLNNPEYG